MTWKKITTNLPGIRREFFPCLQIQWLPDVPLNILAVWKTNSLSLFFVIFVFFFCLSFFKIPDCHHPPLTVSVMSDLSLLSCVWCRKAQWQWKAGCKNAQGLVSVLWFTPGSDVIAAELLLSYPCKVRLHSQFCSCSSRGAQGFVTKSKNLQF